MTTRILLLLFASASAHAATVEEAVARLSDRTAATAALEELVAMKEDALPAVIAEATRGKDTKSRGWAIVALARIGGPEASKTLRKIEEDGRSSMLIRTWAAAARIELATTFAELADLSVLVDYYPAVQRPLSMKAEELATKKGASLDSLLRLSYTDETGMLAPVLAEPILAFGVDPLARAMVRSRDDGARMQAAGYLGTLAERQGAADNEIVGLAVARAYAFNAQAKGVPWAGGALYIPGIAWEKAYATKLVGNLVKWSLYCDRAGDAECQAQIDNNLNSIGLADVVGFQMMGGGATGWLQGWAGVVGKDGIRKILREQGVERDPRYAPVLESLQ